MNPHDLNEKLLYQFKNEKELLDSIQELSTLFTTKRDQLKGYGEDERLVSAYLWFYATTNRVKLNYLFDKFSFLQQLKDLSFTEFGCGPGTFLWSFSEYFNGEHCDLFGVESASSMRQQAKKLLGDKVTVSSALPKTKGGTLLFGHSFNEISNDDFFVVIQQLEPQCLILIEPGTKELFRKYLQVREQITKEYEIFYPCSSNSGCAISDQEDEWCHQIVHTQHHPELERIAQKLKLDRRKMPVFFQLLIKKDSSLYKSSRGRPTSEGVIFRPPQLKKFGVEGVKCSYHAEIQKNLLSSFKFLKRSFSKEEFKKGIKELDSGDLL